MGYYSNKLLSIQMQAFMQVMSKGEAFCFGTMPLL
jgi:hypothetical protein